MPWSAQADEAYRVVKGPASLAITSPTLSMSVEIKEGGRFWSGPDYDTFYTDEPEAPAPVAPDAAGAALSDDQADDEPDDVEDEADTEAEPDTTGASDPPE